MYLPDSHQKDARITPKFWNDSGSVTCLNQTKKIRKL